MKMPQSQALSGFCRPPWHSEQMADTTATADYTAVRGEALVLRGFAQGVVLFPQRFTAGRFVAGLSQNEATARCEPPSRRAAILFSFANGAGEHRGIDRM